MDTTYWGRGFGLMLFKDWITKENLLWYFVKTETNLLYIEGFKELAKQGFSIAAVVCDGRKGLPQSFGDTPVQMCQFHQSQIIRRYLTGNPKTASAIELKAFVALLTKTDKESFVGGLELWHAKWKTFLNERSVNPQTQKSRYTHRKLRSAYFSLLRNMPHLFVWYERMEIGIPNTTNAIDGHFADLKNKLRNHNGLSKARKIKFIDGFLKASTSQSME
jgi:hypothetical protein